MNLGAEISHQYISSPSSLLTGHQVWGMSCAKVNGHPEMPRYPYLATDPSPWDIGLATCARLADVFKVRSESMMKSQALDTIVSAHEFHSTYEAFNMHLKHATAGRLSAMVLRCGPWARKPGVSLHPSSATGDHMCLSLFIYKMGMKQLYDLVC